LKNKKRGQACTSLNKREKRRGEKTSGDNLTTVRHHAPCYVEEDMVWCIKTDDGRSGLATKWHHTCTPWMVRVPRICWHVLSKHQQVILFKNKKDNVKIPKRPLDLVNYLKNRCESTITALMQTLFFFIFFEEKNIL
jgi:hypothetical protein